MAVKTKPEKTEKVAEEEPSERPLGKLRDMLSNSLVERDTEIYAVLLALISREHCLFVGNPGTAKSMLCRSVAHGVTGMRFCERLLAPTTPPETLFGPISLKALREDRYEHVGEGTFTDAELCFADEVFRGSDAIKDTLLHLLGPERQALVGTKQVKVPMISCIGASNTWSDTAGQAAFLDRWLIRKTVRPVSRQGRERLMWETLPDVTPVATVDDINTAGEEAKVLPFTDEAKNIMETILHDLGNAGIKPSDRRVRKSISVARAAAYIEGSDKVEPIHLECLGDVLWDEPTEQPDKCQEIVGKHANPLGSKLTELLREVDEVVSKATDNATRMAAIKKLEANEKSANELAKGGNPRAKKASEYIAHERIRIQAVVMGVDPEQFTKMMAGKAGGK